MVTVSVKWKSDVFEGLQLDGSSMEALQARLFSLTNVPVERQKIMIKGRMIKDDAALAKVADGSKLVLMGSADEVPTGPTSKVVFEEDLTLNDMASIGVLEAPAGLKNLGNTCYLNSSLQCLRAVPELNSQLKNYGLAADPSVFGASAAGNEHKVVQTLGNLYKDLDSSGTAVAPLSFLTAFRQTFPQFDQRDRAGHHSQQDADEALSQLLYTLMKQVKTFPAGSSNDELSSKGIKGLFVGQFQSTITCKEAIEEQPTVSSDEFIKLSCHISIETNHLHDGVRAALEEELEKSSHSLGRNAVYQKATRIAQLPPYMTIQFVRFFWKKDTNKKAKILRKVNFPIRLDLFEFCTDELKKELSTYRDAEELKRDDEEKKAATEENVEMTDAAVSSEIAKCQSTQEDRRSGVYELFAVVTHKGRTADSGHYIGWCKSAKGNWFKYDDDVVTSVEEEEILRLSGGGDWHMAYMLFYRAAPFFAPKKPQMKKKKDDQ